MNNMIKPQVVEDVVEKIGALIPQDLKTMREEFHTNAKAVLVAGLKKMDLVTREEFDVQKAVLAKTREKLKMLEIELKKIQSAKTED
jgi:BMFP domain-containing protein YqiC